MIFSCSGGPAQHIDLAKKLQANQKSCQRTLLKCLKEIAVFEADTLRRLLSQSSPPPPSRWYSLHRNDGIEPDFINAFLKHAPPIDETANDGLALLFLTVGDDSHRGQLVLLGRADAIATLGPSICERLEGKGNGKGQRFQGKVNNLKRIAECEQMISDYFARPTAQN